MSVLQSSTRTEHLHGHDRPMMHHQKLVLLSEQTKIVHVGYHIAG
jgi:hypothetical protein